MPFGAVGEDRDCQEVIPNRPLTIGEGGSRRYRKLIPATRAFPELARRKGVNLEASAFRAIGLPIVIGPADRNKLGMCFLIRHARNGAQGERPCGCGEEEVLRHSQYRL